MPVLLLLLALQDPVPVEAWVDDTLRFRTADRSFEGYLGGFLRVHARTIFDRPDDSTPPLRTVPDGVFLRQARLDTAGVYRGTWAYRVTADFSTGTYSQGDGASPSSGNGALRDAWLEWRPDPAFVLRVGQFFVPLSPEEADSSRWLEFAERAPGNRLAPGRGIGLGAAGDLLDGTFRYHVMLHQGNDLLQDQGRSRADDNDEKGLSALLYAWPHPVLRLGLGAGASDADDVPAAAFDLVSTELSVLYLDSTAGTFDGRRLRADANALLLAGPASLKAELLWREDEVAGAEDLRSWGGYLLGTWLLTGETKQIKARTLPARGWGALELSFRAGRLEVKNPWEAGIASPDGNARAVTAWSAALTWWYGRHLRATLNLVREEYSSPLDVDGRREDAFTGLLVRLQLDY